MPDVIDRPHVHRRASPVSAVSAGRVEINLPNINRHDGGLIRSVDEDSAQPRTSLRLVHVRLAEELQLVKIEAPS